jgi:uncharacterized RDD family membrane protein YckC
MKCPKCGYLGFEHVERCRNCGYDFSLVPPIALPELPIRSPDADDESSPIDDLALIDAAALSPPLAWQMASDGMRVFAPPSAPAAGPESRSTGAARQPPPSRELPLFSASAADDLPLITKPSPPRAPLAVRRATPEVPRVRSEVPRAPLLDLSGPAFPTGATPQTALDVASAEPATVGARTLAVTIDLALLAAIDVIVVYFTMQICGLTVADLHVLPKGPLAAFLVVQNGGYLVAFTAGGQTLGKMAAGIRVISTRGSASIDIGRSLLRTLVWVLLAVPAGLGFVTALFSSERRGLHDQCAGTRVVRAV